MSQCLLLTGGSINLLSGAGTATSSGSIVLRTAASGLNGVSGALTFVTGNAAAGSTGSIALQTGVTTDANGVLGDIVLASGGSTDATGTGGWVRVGDQSTVEVEDFQFINSNIDSSSNVAITIEDVKIENSDLSEIQHLKMTGTLSFESTSTQTFVHTGSAAGDLAILSTNGKVVVEGLQVDDTTISNTALNGAVTVELINLEDNTISHTTTATAIVVEGIQIMDQAMSDVTTLVMTGDLTNSGGDVLLTSTDPRQITHTGSAVNDLSISSTNGKVFVEGVQIDSTAVSSVTTVDMSGDLTTSAGSLLLTSTDTRQITHTGSASGNLEISSTNGYVKVEGVQVADTDVTNVGSVELNKGAGATFSTVTGYGSAGELNSECSPTAQCTTCLGDCDTDADCESGLICRMRDLNDPVIPGCSGSAFEEHDYCGWAGTITSNTASGTFPLVYYSTSGNTCETNAVGTFTLSSTYIKATSVVHAMVSSYTGTFGTNGIPTIVVTSVTNGAATLIVCNNGASALDGAITFNYVVW